MKNLTKFRKIREATQKDSLLQDAMIENLQLVINTLKKEFQLEIF